MAKKNDSITVSINSFNRPQALTECLQSLSNQSIKDFEVLIVNGGEKFVVDEVLDNLSLPFRVRVIQQVKKGLVEARNLCWKEAKSDIVCIIDDDLVVSRDWIKEIKDTFSQDEKIGGVSGPTIISQDEIANRDALSFIEKFEKGNFFWRAVGKFYLDFLLEGKVMDVGRILDCGTFTLGSNYPDCLRKHWLIDVDYLEACHMCFRRELVEQVGGFDYIFTGTSEWSEPDLSFRIRRLGYRLAFNPKAVTEHKVSKQGVFKARTYAFERSVNFINFYYRNIKPDTWQKLTRFHAYLFFMDCYWFYKAIRHKNLNWLTGIYGKFYGLFKNCYLSRNSNIEQDKI